VQQILVDSTVQQIWWTAQCNKFGGQHSATILVDSTVQQILVDSTVQQILVDSTVQQICGTSIGEKSLDRGSMAEMQ